MDDAWVLNYEREGLAICDVLAGRIRVSGFETSSQLHMIIDLIFTFFDKEREDGPDGSTSTRAWRKTFLELYSMSYAQSS